MIKSKQESMNETIDSYISRGIPRHQAAAEVASIYENAYMYFHRNGNDGVWKVYKEYTLNGSPYIDKQIKIDFEDDGTVIESITKGDDPIE